MASDIMRCAVLTAPETFVIREQELPLPGPQQVRLRMEGCGVCASNIPPYEGRDWFEYPFEPGAPGHEGWGVVDAVGADVDDLEVGQRVAALTYHAYATHDLAQAEATVRLPDELADVPVPGEPLGCAMNIFRRSDIRAGQTVAIVGIGFLGALLTGLAEAAGARVIAISRRPTSLEMAERFGAAHTISMREHGYWDIVDQVKELTDGETCDRVIECTGKQEPLNLAGDLTRTRGRLVVAGYHQDGVREVNMQMWNWKGLDVINAHERDQAEYVRGMREAVSALLEGRIDPSPLYTHRFELDRIGDALEQTRQRKPGFMKALITF